MTTDYRLLVYSDGDNGTVTVDVSFDNGTPKVTRVVVQPAPDGNVPPANLLTGSNISPILQATLAMMTPGALATPLRSLSARATAAEASLSLPRQKAARQKRTDGIPTDLGTMYWRLGSIAKVADHYKVDKHTARKWISQLKNRTSSLTGHHIR